MWIKRDFTLSHCHPNIRTIAKPQYVLSGKWWVFTFSHFCPGKGLFLRKLYELAGFVHVKAEIEFRILSEECLTFRTVSLAKRFPNGVEDIQQESWPGSRRCFEANAGFSGYPTKQLGWKGLKASFSFRLKRFHRTKLLFLTHLVRYKTFSRDKISILFWLS